MFEEKLKQLIRVKKVFGTLVDNDVNQVIKEMFEVRNEELSEEDKRLFKELRFAIETNFDHSILFRSDKVN